MKSNLIPRISRSLWILSSDGTIPGPPLENTSLQVLNSRRTAVVSSAVESVIFRRHVITVFFFLFFFCFFLLFGELTELGLGFLEALHWFLLEINSKTSFSGFISNPMNLTNTHPEKDRDFINKIKTKIWEWIKRKEWDINREKEEEEEDRDTIIDSKTRGHSSFSYGLCFFKQRIFFFIRFGLRKGANMET